MKKLGRKCSLADEILRKVCSGHMGNLAHSLSGSTLVLPT